MSRAEAPRPNLQALLWGGARYHRKKCQAGEIKNHSEGTRVGKPGWKDRRKQERGQRSEEKDGEDMADEENKRCESESEGK